MRYLTPFLLTIFALVSVGQADNVYISYTGLDDGAGAMTNTDASGNLGDVVTAHLWYDASVSGQDIGTGIRLDIASSDAGVTTFQSAVSLDFAITVGGVPIANRWLDPDTADGGDVTGGAISADQVSGFGAFTVTGGDGIVASNSGPVFLDAGYRDGNGFYLGSITFEATAGGTTTFTASPWDDPSTQGGTSGAIVNNGAEVAVNFSSATFTVNAIPEPATAGLLAIGLVGLVSRRRR